MGEYDLTVNDIENGIKRFLSEAYATASVSENPELIFISAGPGAGKTTIENFLKRKLKGKGEKSFEVSSDKVAMYDPRYDDAIEELPEECYRITRQFVRQAMPKIMEELMKHKINIINERTFGRYKEDIDLIKKFRESGYKITSNIIATDIFESRLSCFERDARTLKLGLRPRGCSLENQLRMYNSFIVGIQELDRLGLLDNINVFVRGENINKPPILVYTKEGKQYPSFVEAINNERIKQRKKLYENSSRIF